MKYIMSIAACTMMAANALAIVVQDYPVSETAPDGLDWSYVYDYKGSSAVAVGGSWILTAGHVADDEGSGSLSIGGHTYTQQEVVYHDEADLALVRYDMAFQGHYTLYTGGLVGIQVLLVGSGNTGTVSTDYWTMSGTGRGIKRWGSQTIDRTRINQYYAGGMVGFTQNYGFWMDFDLGNTSHEAGTASGDSGSGVFYNDGGVWKLAGINTAVSGSGGQYDSTFAMSIPYYYSWIADTITATPDDDADGDGLTNAEEATLGTDPMSSDTDEDLISDPLELDNGLDPLVSNVGVDSDVDGLFDVDEVTILGTDPLHPDTDRDGLTDAEEVNTYGTDPLRPDTDRDGLSDDAEVNTYGTDPLHNDTDRDRLTDEQEVNTYSTLPNNADSDGDGTTDGDEVLIYGTDPNDPGSDFDLDNDQMADSWEINHFISTENCNPTNDPDGDYYFNLKEFQHDTDPNVFDTYITLWPALKVEWNAASGTVYQVQMSTNLLSGEWIDIGDPVIGSNATQYLLESTRENDRAYYRVLDAEAIIRMATELEWEAAPNVAYQAQISTNGTSGIWYDLGDPILGDGQTHYMIESTHPADNKVYRIQRIIPLSP